MIRCVTGLSAPSCSLSAAFWQVCDAAFLQGLLNNVLRPLQTATAHCLDMLVAAIPGPDALQEIAFEQRMAMGCVLEIANWVTDTATGLLRVS